jgi:hypothetical protein
MKKNYKDFYLLAVVFVLLFIAYECILQVVPADYNDIHDHAAFARQMLQGQRPYAGNFLVYLLVNIFSFFSTKAAPTEIALCMLIAFATTFRFRLAQERINQLIYHNTANEPNYFTGIFYALTLLFVFGIPIPGYLTDDRFMYIGNYVPNVWHNSTILFLFPFAMLLFELSYKQLHAYSTKRNWWIALLVTLNLFIKPSYFFVFVCVYPLLLLVKYKLNKEFWYSILPLIAGLFILAAQYWIIYKIGIPTDKETSSVVFLPFYRNPEFADLSLIPVAMFFSLLFPALYAVFNLSRLMKSMLFWYCVMQFAVSVLIFFFISETGPRASHGNFYWQIVICTWLSFFVAFLALLKDFKTDGRTNKNIFLLSIYMLHVVVGVLYFIRLLLTGGYY